MAKLLLLQLLMTAGLSYAQTATPQTVQATGTATISAKPDQVQLNVGVVTQASTAQDAADQNAAVADKVIAALKAVLGSAGTIQTVSYEVTPRFNSPPTSQPPAITGYTASNTLEITSSDISLAGKLIDAANSAGANVTGSLRFGLQDPDPVKQQALAAAAKQARAHAGAICAGFGLKAGTVISAVEGVSVIPIAAGVTAAASATPIVTGTVTVYAAVTATVQLLP